MRAEKSSSTSPDAVAALLAALERAPDCDAWRDTWRHHFHRLRAELPLHPRAANAAGMFEAAGVTARAVAARSLPLGLALVMHLYPLCALRSVSLPWFSQPDRRRTQLLKTIDCRRLILANAGSERVAGAQAQVQVQVTRSRNGIRVNGTFDYVSLASVADLVLFHAPLHGGHTVFCVADLHADSVRVGEAKFSGSMRLSDTCAVTFDSHHVPVERFIEVPAGSALGCMTLYQRSWFHLLLAETYLARVQELQRRHDLAHPVEQIASLNELAILREYALHLLSDVSQPSAIDSLEKVTAAIKLRVSWIAQATATAVRGRDAEAASELSYIRRQPTSDERILRSITPSGIGHAPFVVAQ